MFIMHVADAVCVALHSCVTGV